MCHMCAAGAWRWHHLLVTSVASCHLLSAEATEAEEDDEDAEEDDDDDEDEDEDDDELPSTAYSFLSNLMILGIRNLHGHGKNPIVW